MTEAWELNADPSEKQEPPPIVLSGQDDPGQYHASSELLRAASVAIRLGMPLLLTGDPGCGKTAFADHLAWRLSGNGSRALKVYARSNMEMQDMFYSYDDVGRFRADGEDNPTLHVSLNGLGEAILRGSNPDSYACLRKALLTPPSDEMTREVVLIDEIDKAPRDVPNDLLSLVSGDKMQFSVREIAASRLGDIAKESNEIAAEGKCQPIIVCTSNSERILPDAFLRRCIYFHIEMPRGEDLLDIIDRRIYGNRGRSSQLVRWAETLLFNIREADPAPVKKPGLAELLNFLRILDDSDRPAPNSIPENDSWKELAKLTLLKTEQDRRDADRLLKLSE